MNWRKRPAPGWKLYCIIDKNVVKGRSPLKTARKLYHSGASIIQLRYKNLPSYRLVDIAKSLRRLAKKHKKILLINDRPDVALASGASGVHLGNGDLGVKTARFLLGPKAVIGKTVHSIRETRKANGISLDYIGAGAVFSTPLKKHLKKQGIEFIRKVKGVSRFPVFAIGGINKKNMKEVLLKSRADGVCIARGILDI